MDFIYDSKTNSLLSTSLVILSSVSNFPILRFNSDQPATDYSVRSTGEHDLSGSNVGLVM